MQRSMWYIVGCAVVISILTIYNKNRDKDTLLLSCRSQIANQPNNEIRCQCYAERVIAQAHVKHFIPLARHLYELTSDESREYTKVAARQCFG